MLTDLYIDEVDLDLLKEQYLALIGLTVTGAIPEDSVLWGLIQMLGDYVGEDTCCGASKVRCDACDKNVCAFGCDCEHERNGHG